MPDGVVQWFDAASGDASVVRDGHVYRAHRDDIDPTARHAGARVHFDIRRESGVESAIAVELRPGTRVSHRQHGFGRLTGARRPDTKGPAPFARPHPELGLSLASHPVEVARAWAESAGRGDRDTAVSLYASDAVVHDIDADLSGRSRLATWLAQTPFFADNRPVDVRGVDGDVVVTWVPQDAHDRTSTSVTCHIEHGQIAEQWIGERTDVTAPVPAGPIPIAVVVSGDVEDDDVAYARQNVTDLCEQIADPILDARVKLTSSADPARERPAIAKASLDINGEIIRAHVSAHTMREAADLLQARLRGKLEQRAKHHQALWSAPEQAQPGEWTHTAMPTAHPEFFDRPVDERQLVRHKTFSVAELTPDEAAFDMEQLDYDFHLFRDLASGQDSVIESLPGGTYRLTRLEPSPVDTGPTQIHLEVSTAAAPTLTVDEAIENLDATGDRFVFFADASTHRGNVVYRRYDGHYGLIAPAT